jgi:DNA-3-methyladenine glycosylase
MSSRLPRHFFAHPTLTVARALLGQRLVCAATGARVAGLICETEAYIGRDDLACHARKGHTARNASMFGPPGHAYVYFIYGAHWMLNCVTEAEGFPAAVLIRAVIPVEGLDLMQQRRKQTSGALANGPAKLTQAFGLDRRWDGHDLCARAATLFIEAAPPVPAARVSTGPRVGLGQTPEPWLSKKWNFQISKL